MNNHHKTASLHGVHLLKYGVDYCQKKSWAFCRIIERFVLKVNNSEISKIVMCGFLYIDSDLEYWYIIWKFNARTKGMNLKNTLWTIPLEVGISCKISGSFFFFLKGGGTRSGRSALWYLAFRSLLDLSNYWSDSWRTINLKGVRWCVDGGVWREFG